MLTSGPELRASIHPGLGAEFGNGESFVADEPRASSILSEDEERPSGKRDVG